MAFTTLVSTKDLAANLGNPDWVIVDCRFTLSDPSAGKKKYHKDHIPGAHYAHLEDDLASPVTMTSGRHPLPDINELGKKLGEWGVSGNKQVVVYDDSFGAIASRLWWLSRWLGHDNVALLDGVYSKWVREKLPVDNRPAKKSHCKFVPAVRKDLVADAEFILRHLHDKDSLIIDARSDIRFTGEQETLDKVAGHIPGAVNRPFDDNLDLGGNFLPLEEMEDEYSAILTDKTISKIIHMCGSGVTACHNILAMECLGRKNSRLYAGSWSHWITDSSRPVATGEA